MKKKFEKLFQKCNIANLEVKNRIVMAPLNNNYTKQGFMTAESVNFYVSRAKGGVGLIIIEATSVDYPQSRSVLNPALDGDKFIPMFEKIATGCHKHGCKVMVQLSHVGRQTCKRITGIEPVAPSPVPCKSILYPDTPRELSRKEIEEIIEKFGKAALRAKKAGLDGIELIMGHGYLANNFLTPVSNLRLDEFGGLKGGLNFCKSLISEVRKTCGEGYPIICRINAKDYIKNQGNTIVEAQLIAQELQNAGTNAISVSAGMRDSELNFNDHTSASAPGGWIHLVEPIKKVLNIPVIAVKRFTPIIAEETLRKGKADFIAFGKQLIADPDFANKVLDEKIKEIIPCTSCCQGCYDRLWMLKPITCMLNPEIGKPFQNKTKKFHNNENKNIIIIGGGPAGCEAALEASKNGYHVSLIEKNNRLGGNYIYSTSSPNKKEIEKVFPYFSYQLHKNKVKVMLETKNAAQLVNEIEPEIIIDASGADFKIPLIKGVNLPHVMTPLQALENTKQIGQNIVIIACSYYCTWTCGKNFESIPGDVVGLKSSESFACAAGHAAADTAEAFAALGKDVSIITERDEFVPGMGHTNRGNLLKRLFQADVSVSNRVKVKEIRPKHLLCEKEGMDFKLYADSVILSVGMKKRTSIRDFLKNCNIEYYQVGDCYQIGNALKAIHGAYELIHKLQSRKERRLYL